MKQERDHNDNAQRQASMTSGKERSTAPSGNSGGNDKPKGTASPVQFPTLSLPKGGGAIQGTGEKFQANPVTETGTMSRSSISNKVFSWLLERTFDNKGNVLIYEYKPEDLVGVDPTIFEKNRNTGNATAQQYLKRVKYGKTAMYSSPMNDPNMRSLDLDGDDIADLLIIENDCFVWYGSKAKEGFDPARRVAKALDEEQGPRIVLVLEGFGVRFFLPDER
jgi:hypothetical protein